MSSAVGSGVRGNSAQTCKDTETFPSSSRLFCQLLRRADHVFEMTQVSLRWQVVAFPAASGPLSDPVTELRHIAMTSALSVVRPKGSMVNPMVSERAKHAQSFWCHMKTSDASKSVVVSCQA